MRESQPGPETRGALDACRAFADLPPPLLDRLFSSMSERRFEPAETLIRQGDAGDFLLVISEGEATGRARDAVDGTAHVVGRFGPGDVVGEMAIVTREPRSADVVADTHVRALVLPAADFQGLVAQHLELGSVLTSLVAERLGSTTKDGLGGKLLNGYRILDCAGRGGMAIVYRAQAVDSGRTVALKMMSHRLLCQQGASNRFRQEAEVLGSLEHANIARLLGGFAAYATYFLVIEYCDGPTLHQLVSSAGALPEATARRVIGQLAHALRYLHERGVAHRDLKPGNVMLTREGVVKLTDFGLARADLAHGDTAMTMTTRGTVLGTPGYMAPEQLSGLPGDWRSDLYALACVAYEMVAGRRLFAGRTLFELIRERIALQLPPPSAIGGGISDEMHDLIGRGLREAPADRDVLLDALTRWAGPVDVRQAAASAWEEDSPTREAPST